MIDHLVGRPSPSWKRTQVFLVICFWLWRILQGNPNAPRVLWFRNMNRFLQRFTPWQLILSTLTVVYTFRNLDKVLGLHAPEPLARLYSPAYYRATWISTGLDAGFATAMTIRPKWVRDIASMFCSVYYIIYANEADEKLRKFRAVPTVEMLRVTWEKTSNPYLRMIVHVPSIPVRRKILLPRPKSSQYQRPITAWLFFARPEDQLCRTTDLILDYPGGGFVAMSPEHHEERLVLWAQRTGKPILSLDYGKAPEYPYPFAIDEAYDTYRILIESHGTAIGMSGRKLNIIISGDSAGACIAVGVVIKILEHNSPTLPPHPSVQLPLPVCLVINYACLDFNFTSWMTPANLRVLRSEQSSGNLPGLKELAAQKDHLKHVSPLSMVGDKRPGPRKKLRRKQSWRDTLIGLTTTSNVDEDDVADGGRPPIRSRNSTSAVRTMGSYNRSSSFRGSSQPPPIDDGGALADGESEDSDDDFAKWKESERPIQARVRYQDVTPGSTVDLTIPGPLDEKKQREMSAAVAEASKTGGGDGKEREPIGTRLTMTSRVGYFQDRIVSPSMMRAMAILYIGPHRNPDFATDYHISPILAPDHLLAQFPPLLMQCGEKDPFVDDTVIFAGRVREAKRKRKAELELAISGKSARFGESLRMSNADSDGPKMASMKRERDRLGNQTEDDWVQMVLFSDWSHGYLQMPGLMSEAKAALEELADWIDDAFKRYASGSGSGDMGHGISKTQRVSSPTRGLKSPPPALAQSMNASPFTSETEDESSSALSFIPKKYRNSPVPSSTGIMDEDSDSEGTASPEPMQSSPPLLGIRVDSSESDSTTLFGSEAESGSAKPLVSGKRGETITETELMRRRRLLDAPLFE